MTIVSFLPWTGLVLTEVGSVPSNRSVNAAMNSASSLTLKILMCKYKSCIWLGNRVEVIFLQSTAAALTMHSVTRDSTFADEHRVDQDGWRAESKLAMGIPCCNVLTTVLLLLLVERICRAAG
jgi:hypothetical protein